MVVEIRFPFLGNWKLIPSHCSLPAAIHSIRRNLDYNNCRDRSSLGTDVPRMKSD